MLIGVPKEIKDNEYRAGTVPSSVQELVHHGHQVLIQAGLGASIGLTDEQYIAAGAQVAGSAEEIFFPLRAHCKGQGATTGRNSHAPKGAGIVHLSASGT